MIHELLSPAGDMEGLKAVVNAGCDAVYLGLKSFSARSYAKNFDRDEFIDAVKYCHLRRVKVYVTMNTLVKDGEVDDFLADIDFIYKNGADAVLMQDFGMIMLVRKMYKDFDIHASTQFNNSSYDTIKFLYDLGVKRVVVSRELSIDEINKIDIPIEIECFVQGALCVSYSGLCLMSYEIGGRSANRGSCAYPCRMPYKLYYKDKLIKDGKILSTKDLMTVPSFNELLKSNIKSFKIEGRMKSPEYVYYVTKFYRNIIDGKGYTKENLDIIKILFNRDFTEGNLFNKNIINGKTSGNKGLLIGNVKSISKKYIELNVNYPLRQGDGIRINNNGLTINYLYDKKFNLTNGTKGICYIRNTFDVKVGDKIFLTSSLYLKNEILKYPLKKIGIDVYVEALTDKPLLISINGVKTYGSIVEKAKNINTSMEDIYKKINRLGDTIYFIKDFKCNVSSDAFIPASVMNNLRRDSIGNYEKSVLKVERREKENIKFDKLNIKCTSYKSLVTNNYEDILSNNYDRYYTNDYNLFNKYKDKYDIYYVEEKCLFKNKNIKHSLRSYYGYPNDSIADYQFNVYNIYTAYFLEKLGYKCITLSPELEEEDVNSLINNFYNKFRFYPNVEVLEKDRVLVMTIKGNVLDIDVNKYYTLVNVNGYKFKVIFDGRITYIYNYKLTSINNVKCNKRFNLE